MKCAMILFLLTSITLGLRAQDGPTEEFEVVKPYQPILVDAVKITFTPIIPQQDAVDINYDYDIPAQLKEVTYAPPVIKPLAFNNKSANEKPWRLGYVKIGLGNLNTPMIQAGIQYEKNKKYLLGAHGNYISSKNNKLENQQMAEGNIQSYAKTYKGAIALSNTSHYRYQQVHFYGYDHDTFTYKAKNIRQVFNTLTTDFSIANYKPNKAMIYANMNAGIYAWNSYSMLKETNWHINMEVKKMFKAKHEIYLKWHTDNYMMKDTANSKNNIHSISPYFKLFRKTGDLYAGVQLAWSNGVMKVLPYTYAEQLLLNNNLIFFSGWNKELKPASYRIITDINPFVSNTMQVKNALVENRLMGIKGMIGNKFDYKLSVLYNIIKDELFFITDTMDTKKMTNVYDPHVRVTNFGLELNYIIKDKWQLGTRSHFYSYELDSLQAAWHRPSLAISLFGEYSFLRNWNSQLQFTHWSKYVLAIRNEVRKISTINDLSVSVRYRINEQFHAFVTLNNLMNQKYERWNNYPSFGFNGLIGAKFSI